MHPPTTAVPSSSDSPCEQQPLNESNESQEINVTRWLQYIRGAPSPEHSVHISLMEAGQGGLEEDYDDLWFHRYRRIINHLDCAITVCVVAAVILVITILVLLRLGVE